MKSCIACAEDIKDSARLCRWCGTHQDDPKFLAGGSYLEEIQTPANHDTFLVELVSKFDDFWHSYGPLVPIKEREASNLAPELVWSQIAMSMYTAITGGYLAHDGTFAIGFYYRASKPCHSDVGSIVDVVYFDCEYCSESDDALCSVCSDTGVVYINIREVVLRSGVRLSSPSEIWSQRIPGGLEGLIEIPSDYQFHSDLELPPWIEKTAL